MGSLHPSVAANPPQHVVLLPAPAPCRPLALPFPPPSRSAGSGWFVLAAAAPTWGACGRHGSFPSLQSSCGQAESCHVASAWLRLHVRSLCLAAGLGVLVCSCRISARLRHAGALPGAPRSAWLCWLSLGLRVPAPAVFPRDGARGCSLCRALAVMEVPEKMRGFSVSLRDTASTSGCHALGCRRACLVLAVPEDSPVPGGGGAPLAQDMRDRGPTALVSCVAGGGDSPADKAGACRVLRAPCPEPFGRRALCAVCPPQEWLPGLLQPPSPAALASLAAFAWQSSLSCTAAPFLPRTVTVSSGPCVSPGPLEFGEDVFRQGRQLVVVG